MKLSKGGQGIIIANKQGYKIVDGNIFNPKNRVLKGGRDKDGYHFFSIREQNIQYNIRVHRLLAFQKYGMAMFESGIVVRHLNGNNKDNSDLNIAIGTVSENEMDKPIEQRKKVGLRAAECSRKYTNEFINTVRQTRIDENLSYAKLAKKFNLPTPSVAHLIVNNNYQTYK